MSKAQYVSINGVWRKIVKKYVSINGVWRKIVKKYVSINGVWRKVKKTYVSINGVWRDCTPPSIGGGGKIVAGAPKIIIPQAGAWNIFLMRIDPGYAYPRYDIDNRRPEDNMYNAIISDEQLNPGTENPNPIFIYLSRREVGLPAGEYAGIDDDFTLMYFHNLTPATGSSAWNAGDYVEARYQDSYSEYVTLATCLQGVTTTQEIYTGARDGAAALSYGPNIWGIIDPSYFFLYARPGALPFPS